jgi:hypothetical protein
MVQGQEITREKQDTGKLIQEKYRNQRGIKRDHVIGFVPIQVVNLSLEEVEMPMSMYVGVASPTGDYDVTDLNMQDVCFVQGRTRSKMNTEVFEQYLQEKLGHLTGEYQKLLGDILRKYCHLFYELGSREIGCTSYVKHAIDTGDARAIKKNPYRIPHALKSVVDEHIQEMIAKGIIEPSASPWSSSIVLVQKKTKDGSIKYRFCIDYRALNAVTKPDAYPIPNIVDTLDSLGHSKIFTVLDMASGYHQIEIRPEDREKTAFSCHKGRFQFVKMSFGLNNAPATYQRCMDVILMGLKGIDCLAYLDDVICFTMEEHVVKLEEIFKRLDKANFKIQPDECVFGTDTVEYLGQIVTRRY